MGGKFVALATLVIVGVIVADGLIHPKGVAAFGNATVGVLRPTYGALLGKAPRGR